MKLMSNDDIKMLMHESHNVFFGKYKNKNLNKDSPEWEDVISDANALMKKYGEFQHMQWERDENGQLKEVEVCTANDIINWFLTILELRCRDEQ